MSEEIEFNRLTGNEDKNETIAAFADSVGTTSENSNTETSDMKLLQNLATKHSID